MYSSLMKHLSNFKIQLCEKKISEGYQPVPNVEQVVC